MSDKKIVFNMPMINAGNCGDAMPMHDTGNCGDPMPMIDATVDPRDATIAKLRSLLLEAADIIDERNLDHYSTTLDDLAARLREEAGE